MSFKKSVFYKNTLEKKKDIKFSRMLNNRNSLILEQIEEKNKLLSSQRNIPNNYDEVNL